MQCSVTGHVCQISASSVRIIEEHRWQTFILAVETTGDEDACICDGYSMATENLRQWIDVAEKTESGMSCLYAIWNKIHLAPPILPPGISFRVVHLNTVNVGVDFFVSTNGI